MEEQKDIALTDLLRAIPNPSPAFRSWIGEALQKGQLTTIVAGAIKSGKVKDETEALAYFNELLKDVSRNQRRLLTSFDLFNPRKSRSPYARLRASINGEERTGKRTSCRIYGIIGHHFIPELLTGNLPEATTFSFIREKETLFKQQLPLLEDVGEQRTFVFEKESYQPNGRNKARALKQAWEALLPFVKGDKESIEVIWSHPAEVQRLYRAAEEVFGNYVERIRRRGQDAQELYFQLLTLMSWATAFLYWQDNGNRILFREIPVLAKKYRIGGGRIDAIEVKSINGKPPTETEEEQLRLMARHKYSSAGELLHQLKSTFGNEIELEVLDWKFAVGDGSFNVVKTPDGKTTFEWQVIQPADIEGGPFQEHNWQMLRYLALASLDFHLLSKEKGIENHWPENNQFLSGEIIYFLPGIAPVTHEVTTTIEDQESFLKQEVAGKWSLAERRSLIRRCSHLVIKEILSALGWTRNSHRLTESKKEQRERLQVRFFTELEGVKKEESHVERMIEDRRTFLDPDQIIEQVGFRDNKPQYELHIDRLFGAMKDRRISPGYFSLPRGGHIRCLNPEHSDRDPSMYIWVQSGTFKCFGCGIRGVIAPNSIPEDLDIPILPPSWVRKTQAQTLKVGVPDAKHIRILTLAQELLLAAFKGSPAEKYLVEKRRLDADLAFSLGAGFGRDSLIEGLLEAGFSYDDLIFYGFASISSQLSPEKGMGPILKRHGLSEREMRREAGRMSKKGKMLCGYPQSVLEDRLTFPLTLDGKINNFYGRSIRLNADKKVFHRKLSVAHTGIPQGGFNMEVLDSGVKEVIAVEAALDAVTVIQWGLCQYTLGMIGVENRIIIEAMARSDKNLGIGLDYDKTGREKTHGVYDELGREKIPGLIPLLQQKGKASEELRDFTEDFVASHPEVQKIIEEKGAKDWNEWWIELDKQTSKGA